MTSRARKVVSTIVRMNEAVLDRLDATADRVNPYLKGFLSLQKEGPSSIKTFVSEAQASFLTSFRLGFEPARGSLPHLIHRVLITVDQRLDEFALNQIRSDAHSLKNYIHYVWCGSLSGCESIRKIFEYENNIVVLSFDQLKMDSLWISIKKLIDEKKFDLASHFIKILILKRHGGLCCEPLIKLEQDCFDVALLADVVLFLGEGGVFNTSVIGARAGSSFLHLVRAALLRPDAVTFLEGRAAFGFDAAREADVLGAPGFTALLLLFLPANEERIFIVTREESGDASRMSVPTASGALDQAPALIDAHNVGAANAQWESRALVVKGLTKLALQIRVILGLISVFDSDPTRLQRIMNFFGSDKGTGWHNYAAFYEYILRQYVKGATALLEIGIGTNNPDLPSTMGAMGSPGASLRGWREFFTPRAVIGADIDRDILFSEPNIDTRFVDQRSEETLTSLWKDVSTLGLELIIDDGLHEYDANALVMETVFKGVPSLKLFIIEDVASEYVDVWKNHLSASDFDYLFIDIPNAENTRDNRLIFVARKN